MSVPVSKFGSVEYYIISDEENARTAAVTIGNKENFRGMEPVEGGIYDKRMGSTSYIWSCNTCMQHKVDCPGHHGMLPLRYPVKKPMFIKALMQMLKVICHQCGSVITENIPPVKKYNIIVEIAKKSHKDISECAHCGFAVRKLSSEKHTPHIFDIHTMEGEKPVKLELTNDVIYDILQRVTEETARKIGWKRNHPKSLMTRILRIAPNTLRPDIRKVAGGKSRSDEVTALIKTIFEKNMDIQPIDDTNDIDGLQTDNRHLLDIHAITMIKGAGAGADTQRITISASNKPPMSLIGRTTGKNGHYRRFLLGKRVFMISRAVITTDPRVRVNELGVPKSIASRIQIPEVVRFFNIERLTMFFMNRRNKYPGVTDIVIDGKKTRINRVPDDYQLKYGDVVFRDLIDGDWVLFNRQPSLTYASIGAHQIRIVEYGLCIRMNVSACPPYNADFDGDQMHLIVCQDIQARVEIARLSSVSQWMVSYQTSAPSYGNYYDSLIGIALITRSGVVFGRDQAMQLFANIHLKDRNLVFDKKTYTGRDLVSMLLPDINYGDRSPSFYMKQYAHLIKYDPSDIVVRIKRGQLVSGILDKACAGEESQGSIFHVIANEYGPNVALETIFNFHQLANAFLYYRGFTLGIKDLQIPKEAEDQINSNIANLVQDSLKITEKLNNRTFEAPKEMTIQDFYESEQLSALDPGDTFIHAVFKSVDFYKNNMAGLIFHKSKGKPTNFVAINAAIGSQLVGDRRPPLNFSGRTSPYFCRYDDSPLARGYVIDSWRKGIRPELYINSCAESRHGLVNNVLSTSIAGEQTRTAVKNMDSIITDNMRKSMKGDNVVQILYGGDGVDTRKLLRVKIPTVKITHAEFEKYRGVSKSPKEQAALASEFAQLKADREQYRQIYLRLGDSSGGKYIFDDSVSLPVNPHYTIENTLQRHTNLAGALDLVDAVKMVEDLCSCLPYAYTNKFCEEQRVGQPEVYLQATTLLRITVRAHLCTHNLLRMGVSSKHLTIIADLIKNTFINSLISSGMAVGVMTAQCMSAPITQLALDSKHKSGSASGSSRSSISTLDRIKEIWAARPTKNMKAPEMTIMLDPKYEDDKEKVQEIASYIKMMKLGMFVQSAQIFQEFYGSISHPDYAHEAKWIEQASRFAGKPPINLLPWCVRFTIDREELYTNNINMEHIMSELRNQSPHYYIVNTPELAKEIVIRIYFKPTAFTGSSTPIYEDLRLRLLKIKDILVRGVRDIVNTEVIEVISSKVKPDGAIEQRKVFAISTSGSNLEDVLCLRCVDPTRTQTNSIIEHEDVYGIESARNKIVSEIYIIMNNISSHRYLFADEMTFSSWVTSIRKTGLGIREKSNVLLRLAFQAPTEIIRKAAIEEAHSKVTGITGPFIHGQIPEVGSCYNELRLNRDMVRKHAKKYQERLIEEI